MKYVLTVITFSALFMVAVGLLCIGQGYECNGSCRKQRTLNCTKPDYVCTHILYNDGRIFKTCYSEDDFYSKLRQLDKTKLGIDEFTYKCDEDFCNNRSLQDEKCNPVDRLQCTSCNGDCSKPKVAVCTQKQNRCFSFTFEDGNIQKGCVIGNNYNNVFKRANNTHGGLKDESYQCSSMFCNANNTKSEEAQDDGNGREGPEGDALKYCQSLINN